MFIDDFPQNSIRVNLAKLCYFQDCSLGTESGFNSPINIPPVHDSEDPNFIFDDLEHHAILSDAEFPITL